MSGSSRTPADLLSRSLSGGDLPDPATSLELLTRAQEGDHAALEDLVRRYQDRLRRIVRIQLGGSDLRREHDSMDIVQNTFRAALPKIADLRPRSAAGLLQWLAVIATNQIRDAHDRRNALKREGGRELQLTDSVYGRLVSGEPLPEENALMSEVREMLDEEVARLPTDQRRAVLLRDYCGEEWERIAAELEREPGAARQLHQRAWIRLRQALRPRLAGRDLEPGDGPTVPG